MRRAAHTAARPGLPWPAGTCLADVFLLCIICSVSCRGTRHALPHPSRWGPPWPAGLLVQCFTPVPGRVDGLAGPECSWGDMPRRSRLPLILAGEFWQWPLFCACALSAACLGRALAAQMLGPAGSEVFNNWLLGAWQTVLYCQRAWSAHLRQPVLRLGPGGRKCSGLLCILCSLRSNKTTAWPLCSKCVGRKRLGNLSQATYHSICTGADL